MERFNFIGNSKKFFTLSIVLIAVVLVSLVVFGLQLDIQFRGGSIITYTYESGLDVDAFEKLVQDLTHADISLQRSTDLSTNQETLVINLPGTEGLDSQQMRDLNNRVVEEFPGHNVQVLEISNVDPTIGNEFLAKCLTAVVLASVLMVIFVWLRFRKIGGLSAGVMAVIALVHDIIIVFGVFIILGMPINDNFIAVLLTILGYSLNDTIVIYDRIRENRKKIGRDADIAQVVNLSLNQSFKRTLITSITTVSAMLVVTIVSAVYGVSSIISFSLPLIVGLASGSYSSICIAGPLWVKWQQRKKTA